ncbi:hypothetical protein C6A87_027070 [Mycobacterium sp. ITM-2016-00317]|uniref:hypothetical protein n=1 Tax=Mycobacterium sp. ITM-2016-00317 TaxID=2099694 RepID=UPI00287FD637|nr:hypothetical protein [Mycobacterium sp. ITM-2016-00317]WNG87361.1 hypothetical protein C6A87_027070 [Mycobacterium sp. ITM-2016-00317]
MSGAPARLRGAAAGLLTAALTLAAHSVGGGVVPAGASTVLLALIAVMVAALASTIPRADGVPVLVSLLGAGQLAGHATLAAQHHTHAAPPAWAMASAHTLAVLIGAALIVAGARLCRALSAAVRLVRARSLPSPAARGNVAARFAEHPMRSALLLACSMSHRGPPVALPR